MRMTVTREPEEDPVKFEWKCVHDASADRGPSIRADDAGSWWWADETWTWHGPCPTERAAQLRQSMYCRWVLGEPFPPDDAPVPATQDAWEAARTNGEHSCPGQPCPVPEPWDCSCGGSCECHWNLDTEGD